MPQRPEDIFVDGPPIAGTRIPVKRRDAARAWASWATTQLLALAEDGYPTDPAVALEMARCFHLAALTTGGSAASDMLAQMTEAQGALESIGRGEKP